MIAEGILFGVGIGLGLLLILAGVAALFHLQWHLARMKDCDDSSK